MKFFSLNKSQLAANVFEMLNIQNKDSNLTIDEFSDGEFQPIFRESVRDEEVYIMADGSSANDIVRLCLTIDAAKRADAKSVNVIYPFAPYSRQDKLKGNIRSSISARTLADMLQAVGLSKLITIELHAGAIMGFYNVPVIHLNGNKIFTDYIKSLKLNNICICPPDAGATERNRDFAKAFPDSVSALIEKTRVKFNEIASMVLIGEENVVGRNVLTIDDMVDTAGTLNKSSILLKQKGALTIRAVGTHGVLSGKWDENIYNSALTELVISDTVRGTYEKVEYYNGKYTEPNKFGIIPRINIISSSEFLSETIERLNNKKSINELNTVS